MPIISYSCNCGKVFNKYFKKVDEILPQIICTFCGKEAKKVFGKTSTSHKITIDNGLMARSIDVDPNIMDINEERSSRDYSEED